ncbi:MAG: tetratricopeptide repeat protein [Bacteroidota bacterium]|jgi:tetratricopeptide (TPR) repeat protein
MADNTTKTVSGIEEEKVVATAKDFWSRFSKPIIYAGGAIILLIGGWLGYQQWVVAPKQKKANDAISKAQEYFGKDSLRLALDGDGANAGFLKIIKNYSGTDAANLAHYYAGAIYLRQDDFANAIKYLEQFSTKATQVQSAAWRMLGDAYMSSGKQDKGVEYYLKAGNLNDKDEYTSSENLYLAALAYTSVGKNKEAIEVFKTLKEKYPKSEKAAVVEKYLAKLGVIEND